MKPCLCGCGETAAFGASFIPGHDQRAIHAIIREQYGSVRQFVVAHTDSDATASVT